MVDLFGNMLQFSVMHYMRAGDCLGLFVWVHEADNNSLTYCCPVPLSLSYLFFQTLLRSFKDNLNPVFELDLTLKLVDNPCTINKNIFKMQSFICSMQRLRFKNLHRQACVFGKCGHNRSILVIFLELNRVTEQEHWTQWLHSDHASATSQWIVVNDAEFCNFWGVPPQTFRMFGLE